MFRLSREVRFAVNRDHFTRAPIAPTNTYAGYPSLQGLGHYFALDVTVAGELDPSVQYLVDIKSIDSAVRERDPLVAQSVLQDESPCPNRLIASLFQRLSDAWPGRTLDSLRLALSPFVNVSAHRQELPMTRWSERFEFSASHRLHNEKLSDEANRKSFGKCNNPHGHGHNYELQVTLIAQPGERTAGAAMVDVPAFERIVADTVIARFDHKNLNVEVPEFTDGKLVPSVENIAMVIYRLLKPAFEKQPAKLASVTVWETPKTFCEYSE